MSAHATTADQWETSPAPFLVAVGCLLVLPLPFASYFQYQKLGMAVGFLGVGVPILLSGIAIWVQEGVTQKHGQFGYSQLALPIFIISEALIFLGLFASYWILRLLASSWPPEGSPHLDITIPAIMTAVLITSSITYHLAEGKLEKGDMGGFKSMLGFTFLLGVLFLGMTVFEYSHLIGEKFTPSANIFGSAFYSITGFHAAHVVIGLCLFIAVMLPALKGKMNMDFVKCAGVYWHFVDVVWFFVVSQIYLW